MWEVLIHSLHELSEAAIGHGLCDVETHREKVSGMEILSFSINNCKDTSHVNKGWKKV